MCALLVPFVASAACSFKILEDIGSDPHPPTVDIAELLLYVAPPEPAPEPVPEPVLPDSVASSRQGRSVGWDSRGFTLTTDQLFQIRVTYTDAGGDIVKLLLRDRDGSLQVECLPINQTYFPGTAGTVLCPMAAVGSPPGGIEITGLIGRHRVQLWAEDSHLSLSEKVEFIINIVP